MKVLPIWAVFCAAAASAPGNPGWERRSLTGMISASDLIVFAQTEDATAMRRMKNQQAVYLTRIKVFQNIKGKAPSRYLVFSSRGESPAHYDKGVGAVILLKKVPRESPAYNASPYQGLQNDEDKILLSGTNDLAVIDAVRKVNVALGISDPPVRDGTLKNLLLDLLAHPEERIRHDAISDVARLVNNSDGVRLTLSRDDLERLVRVASSADIDLLTRQGTVSLLGKMKDIEALLFLTKTDAEPLRITAIDMLGRCRDERAVDPMMEIARNGKDVERKAAILALGNIGGTKVQKFLKKLIRREDSADVSTWAREALSHSSHQSPPP